MNHAVELTSVTHSELTLLSVINENPLFTSSILEEQTKLRALHQDLVYHSFPKENVKIENNPSQGVSYICNGTSGELRIRSKIENGNPIDVICDFGNQIDADLIIVGSRGLGEIGALIGSISEKIVRKSSRTVMVVKNESQSSDIETGRKGHSLKN